MLRNNHIIGLKHQISLLIAEKENMNHNLRSLGYKQDPKIQICLNSDKNHVEFSTIQENNVSMTQSLDPDQQERLMQINNAFRRNYELADQSCDQNCMIQDMSGTSIPLEEEVAKNCQKYMFE